MCQLFGLSSAKPVNPAFSLRGFFARGGGTDHHADGWGLAYFDHAGSHVRVRDTAAHQCSDAQALLSAPFKSANIIAHVRKATVGEVKAHNSHPFVRRLWGKDWVFAHNGDLKDYDLKSYDLKSYDLKGYGGDVNGAFTPAGDTDSEAAFCHLLSSLSERFGDREPTVANLSDHLATVSREISRHGPFNFLLSDGRLMMAHCSTDLYWTERDTPLLKVESVDTAEAIDFVNHNDEDDRVVIVATKPLTRGEIWRPMVKNELAVFVAGKPRYSTALPHTRQGHTDRYVNNVTTWSTGWHLPTSAWV